MKKIVWMGILLSVLLFLTGCQWQTGSSTPKITIDETHLTPTPIPPEDALFPPFDESLYSGYELELRLNLSRWNLGHQVISYLSLEKDYDWYLDQIETEPFGDYNCVLASIWMVATFLNPNHSFSVTDTRLATKPYQVGYNFSETIDLLTSSNINYEKKPIDHYDDIVWMLERGYVAIVLLDLRKIPFGAFDSESRVNRYSLFPYYHAIVIKGFLETDQGKYVQVYDPYSNKKTYENQSYIGMNRYYEVNDFIRAMNPNNRVAIVILGEISPNS